jgi:hypothetical protein
MGLYRGELNRLFPLADEMISLSTENRGFRTQALFEEVNWKSEAKEVRRETRSFT